MFGRKKEYYCELCNKKLVGFLSKIKRDNKIYCSDCAQKIDEAKEAAMPSIQPTSKFNPKDVERKPKNEIVFWLDRFPHKDPIRFHIFFLLDYDEYGDRRRITFFGMDRFSGKPAIVTWDKEEEYEPHRVKVDFLSREQFNDFLSQYPYEVRKLFDGYSPENWQDYQKVNKHLSLANVCTILFRENNKGRVEIFVCSDLFFWSRSSTTKGTSAEYIEISKEKFEEWRKKNSILDMVSSYYQLREDGLWDFVKTVYKKKRIDHEIKVIIEGSGFWNNAKKLDDGIVENYNCIIMMNQSKFVCTKKLSQEDIDSIFNMIMERREKTKVII